MLRNLVEKDMQARADICLSGIFWAVLLFFLILVICSRTEELTGRQKQYNFLPTGCVEITHNGLN